MTQATFFRSLQHPEPPPGLSALQTGLWQAAKGNWTAAHQIAQAGEGHQDFDWLHGYLHLLEGDDWNGRYWYRRAGLAPPTGSLEAAFEALLEAALD